MKEQPGRTPLRTEFWWLLAVMLCAALSGVMALWWIWSQMRKL